MTNKRQLHESNVTVFIRELYFFAPTKFGLMTSTYYFLYQPKLHSCKKEKSGFYPISVAILGMHTFPYLCQQLAEGQRGAILQSCRMLALQARIDLSGRQQVGTFFTRFSELKRSLQYDFQRQKSSVSPVILSSFSRIFSRFFRQK